MNEAPVWTEQDAAALEAVLKVQKRLYHWTAEQVQEWREKHRAASMQDRIEHPDPLEGLL